MASGPEVKTRSSRLLALYSSPVGKKILTGITGLVLALFVTVHMIGNLSYFAIDPDAYNIYGNFLISLGPILYLVELVLLAAFIFHVTLGISIWLRTRRARSSSYDQYRSKGRPSLQGVSSRSMLITGVVLLVFVIVHLASFKFGPYYETMVAGEPIRDLRRLLEENFAKPTYAFGYTAVMLLLALHLRHGIWSALQSLGAMAPRWTPVIYTVGTIIGLLIAIGFLVLPLYIYFTV
ncbi:MAG: succinate dehydrogenase cytochrome b subunit [Bacteroidota bacterium]